MEESVEKKKKKKKKKSAGADATVIETEENVKKKKKTEKPAAEKNPAEHVGEKKKKKKSKKGQKEAEAPEESPEEKLKKCLEKLQSNKKNFLKDWLGFLKKLKKKGLHEDGKSEDLDLDTAFALLGSGSGNSADSPFLKCLVESQDLSSVEKSFIDILKLSLEYLIERIPQREAAKDGAQSSADMMRDTIFQLTLSDIAKALSETAIRFQDTRMLMPALNGCIQLICRYIGAVPHSCRVDEGECECINLDRVDKEVQSLLLLAIDEAPSLVEPHLGILWQHYSKAPSIPWILCLKDLYPVYARNEVSKQFTLVVKHLEEYFHAGRAVTLDFGYTHEEEETGSGHHAKIGMKAKMNDYVRVCLSLLLKIAETNARLFTGASLDVLELYILEEEIPNSQIVWTIFERIAQNHPTVFKKRGGRYYEAISKLNHQKLTSIGKVNDLFLSLAQVWDRVFGDRALLLMSEGMKRPDPELKVEIMESWRKFSKKHGILLVPFEPEIKQYAKGGLLKTAAEETLRNIQHAKDIENNKIKTRKEKQKAEPVEFAQYSSSCVIF